MKTVNELLKERQQTHGSFSAHAKLSVTMKDIIRVTSKDLGVELTAVQQEALDMICHKIARIMAGDANHIDHWADIAGYSTLVVRELERTDERV